MSTIDYDTCAIDVLRDELARMRGWEWSPTLLARALDHEHKDEAIVEILHALLPDPTHLAGAVP